MQVCIYGHLRVSFLANMKILCWEFLTNNYNEFIHVTELNRVSRNLEASGGIREHMTRDMIRQSPVNEYGLTDLTLRTLEIAECLSVIMTAPQTAAAPPPSPNANPNGPAVLIDEARLLAAAALRPTPGTMLGQPGPPQQAGVQLPISAALAPAAGPPAKRAPDPQARKQKKQPAAAAPAAAKVPRGRKRKKTDAELAEEGSVLRHRCGRAERVRCRATRFGPAATCPRKDKSPIRFWFVRAAELLQSSSCQPSPSLGDTGSDLDLQMTLPPAAGQARSSTALPSSIFSARPEGHLPEKAIFLILSHMRVAAGEEARALYAGMMCGIGSASRSWRSFAKNVLMEDELAWLSVSGAAAADCLTAFPHAHSLRITGDARAADIAAVVASRPVVRLALASNGRLLNCEGLGRLVGLHTLQITGCQQLKDARGLAGLVRLHTLSLSSCPQLSDVRALSSLVGLRSLDLSRCEQLRNVQPLSALVGLQTLDLRWCSQLGDLGALSALVGLRTH